MNRSPEQSTSHQASGLLAFQQQFADRIRNPDEVPLPTRVARQRMAVYEDLLFRNMESFLLACFPVTRKLLGDDQWHSMARQFFSSYLCRSPLFRDIPGEFLQWMESRADQLFPGKPFLYQFMHYEWLEMAVSIADVDVEAEMDCCDSNGDLLEQEALVNPSAEIACYHFPVHLIGPAFQPQQADGQIHCYLLYRDRDHRVQFRVLNPVSARLLELVQHGQSGGEALKNIAEEIKHNNPEALVAAGVEQLQAFRNAGVILGTRTTT